MQVGDRRCRIAVALVAGLAVGALFGTTGVLANHIPGATYTGTVSGGGTVTLTVASDGSKVSSFAANSFGGPGCVSSVTVFNLAIIDHQFTRTSPSPYPHVYGNFSAVQSVSGTVRAFAICDTGTLAWSATTDAQADTTPPVTTITGGPDGLTNDGTPTFSFFSELGATFECRFDSASFASCTSPHTPAGALSDAPHMFEVRATDAAHNTEDPPKSRQFTVDTTPPETVIDAGPPAGAISPASFAFHASEPASFRCSVDGAGAGPCTSPYTVALLPGSHSFTVFATDAAGNVDPTPASWPFTIATPPTGGLLPGPGPAPLPGPAPVAAASTAPADVELRVVRTAGLAAALSKGLPATFGCPVGCEVSGRLLLARKTAKKLRIAAALPVVVGTGRARSGPGRATLRVRFTSRARKRLRRVRRVDLTLRVTFALPGRRPTLTRRVTLKRGAPAATAPGVPSGGGTGTTPGTGTTTPGTGTTPPSGGTGTASNLPPAFPSPLSSTASTQYHYDPSTGYLTGATTTVTITTPATDPDGDPLTYTWTATNGSVQGNGLSATWQRVISFGQPADGDLVVTASDGRGGSDTHTFQFR